MRPTILQIIPQLDTGGAELATIEITDAVVRAGGRALVVTSSGRMADRVTPAGGEIIFRPVREFGWNLVPETQITTAHFAVVLKSER